ncbi:MAG: helix-turn-helix domain-containing protein [Patescibacteria group bacterium]|nr:helix-turn-helix domain-containing protein [Patescibacteria group bacterium]
MLSILNQQRIKLIQTMRKDRYTYKTIAKHLGISRQRIYEILENAPVDEKVILAKISKNKGT